MAAGNNLCNLSITSNNFLKETSVEGETRLNFPLSMDSNNFKSKIKWLGDMEELKSFVDKQLKFTDRQIDREIDRKTDRKTDRQTDRQKNRPTDR